MKSGIGFRSNRGYDGIGRQVLDAKVGGDRKESVLYGVELAPDHPYVLAGLPNHVPNPWPPGLPGWRETVQAYYAAMDRLSRTLLKGLALSLKLPWDFFEPAFELPMSSVRLLHYPSHLTPTRREMGAAAHTDWGLITLLAQDETGGLEIQLPSGEWIAGKPVPNAFIVNMGDMMARWTNDYYRSTPHRVMNRSPKDRYRSPSFATLATTRRSSAFRAAPTLLVHRAMRRPRAVSISPKCTTRATALRPDGVRATKGRYPRLARIACGVPRREMARECEIRRVSG